MHAPTKFLLRSVTSPKPALPAPKEDGPMMKQVCMLLERRIREFHKDDVTTRRLLNRARFSDRLLSEREKLNLLAICRCYNPRVRQLTLLNYVGYLDAKPASDVDLPNMLHEFRAHPSRVLDVSSFILYELRDIRYALTRPPGGNKEIKDEDY